MDCKFLQSCHFCRVIVVFTAVFAQACNSGIYTRDGVTDGDTFYLPEYVMYDNDPALQAWVAYNLDLSTCQLTMGGDNPARNSSFECEHGARVALLEKYQEDGQSRSENGDEYLDALVEVNRAGYLREYVVDNFHRRDWQVPEDLQVKSYRQWKKKNLRRHRRERRIIGSWNYKDR